jgi:HEAT repeat protein
MRGGSVLVVLLALPSWAFAHGGGFPSPPGGPTAAPGLGDPPIDPNGPNKGPQHHLGTTRWEMWWADNREALVKFAERADARQSVALTPAGDGAVPTDAASKRAALAAKARGTVLPVLLRALEDTTDYDVRASAAIALGKAGDASASAPLRKLARNDRRDEVRRAAIVGLGLLGRIEELPFLTDVANDRSADADDRGMALIAVGLLGGDEAAQWLVAFTERPRVPDAKKTEETELMADALAALGATGSPFAAGKLGRVADDTSVDLFFREHAVLALGRLRDRGSLPRLLKLLGHEEERLRRCAAAALGRVALGTDASAVSAMTGALGRERDAVARFFLVQSMGVVRAPAVASALRARLEDGPWADRAYVAIALGAQGDVAAAPLLRKACKKENEESARAAIFTALGLLGDMEAVPLLESELGRGSSPGTHRGYAAFALGVMPSPASKDVLWKRLAEEEDPRVRADYEAALGFLGDERVKALLVKEMNDATSSFARCAAAACLGVLRRADAVPDLVAVVENPRADGIVRSIAIVALGQIVDPCLVPKLARLPAGGEVSLSTKALSEALTIL